jgi:hypothetical protein
MELDTAVRHKLPLLCVIGWTADPERNKPGRDLGYTRYDKMAEALGCYAEYVEEPEEIRPALLRVEEGRAGDSRLCQCQDRLPRPRDDRALLQPRDLSPAQRTKRAPPGAPFA